MVLRPYPMEPAGRREDGGKDAKDAEGEEEEPLFSAEGLRAGEHAATARQQLRQLRTTPSASALLRDVRGIRMPRQAAASVAPGDGVRSPANAPGTDVELDEGGRAASGSGELPVSFSRRDPDSSHAQAAPFASVLAAEPAGPAGTPAFRSAALSRLAQIFGGPFRRRGSSEDGMPALGSAGSGSNGAGQAPEEMEAEADEEAGTAAASARLSPGGFTPVQRYLDYR